MATPREQLANILRQARLDAGYESHAALALCAPLSTSYLGQDACQPVTSTEFTPTVPVKSMPVPP